MRQIYLWVACACVCGDDPRRLDAREFGDVNPKDSLPGRGQYGESVTLSNATWLPTAGFAIER